MICTGFFTFFYHEFKGDPSENPILLIILLLRIYKDIFFLESC